MSDQVKPQPMSSNRDRDESSGDAVQGDLYNSSQKFFVNVVTKEMLTERDVVIAVMGPTGSGKSTFIERATGLEGLAGHRLESQTSEIRALRVTFDDTSTLVLADTPGFDDTYKSDLDILKMISDWLKETYKKKIYLSGILYFHDISSVRITHSLSKNLDMFMKVCGSDGFRRVIITTTMWNKVEPELGNHRERERTEKFWGLMVKGGAQILRFTNTQGSAWNILNNVIALEFGNQAVQIQNELVDLNKNLPKTQAGQQLHVYIEQLVERQKEVLDQLKRMSKTSDPGTIKELRQTIKELRGKRDAAIADMYQLDPTLLGKLRRFFMF